MFQENHQPDKEIRICTKWRGTSVSCRTCGQHSLQTPMDAAARRRMATRTAMASQGKGQPSWGWNSRSAVDLSECPKKVREVDIGIDSI